jgi:hypothetical protein
MMQRSRQAGPAAAEMAEALHLWLLQALLILAAAAAAAARLATMPALRAAPA